MLLIRALLDTPSIGKRPEPAIALVLRDYVLSGAGETALGQFALLIDTVDDAEGARLFR